MKISLVGAELLYADRRTDGNIWWCQWSLLAILRKRLKIQAIDFRTVGYDVSKNNTELCNHLFIIPFGIAIQVKWLKRKTQVIKFFPNLPITNCLTILIRLSRLPSVAHKSVWKVYNVPYCLQKKSYHQILGPRKFLCSFGTNWGHSYSLLIPVVCNMVARRVLFRHTNRRVMHSLINAKRSAPPAENKGKTEIHKVWH